MDHSFNNSHFYISPAAGMVVEQKKKNLRQIIPILSDEQLMQFNKDLGSSCADILGRGTHSTDVR